MDKARFPNAFIAAFRRSFGRDTVGSQLETYKSDPDFLQYLYTRKVDSLLFGVNPTMKLRQPHYDWYFEAQKRELCGVVGQLRKVGIRPIGMKAIASSSPKLSARALGVRNDIDLIVSPEQVAEAHNILRNCGYLNGDFDRNTCSIRTAPVQQSRGSTTSAPLATSFGKIISYDGPQLMGALDEFSFPSFFTAKTGASQSCLIIDVSVGIDTNITFSKLQPLCAETDGGWLRLPPELEGWHLCAYNYLKYAFRRSCKLRPLVDLAFLIDQGLDISKMLEISQKTRSIPAIYYYFSFVRKFILDIKQDLPVEFDLRLNDRLFDYGWQISRYLGTIDHMDPETR